MDGLEVSLKGSNTFTLDPALLIRVNFSVKKGRQLRPNQAG